MGVYWRGPLKTDWACYGVDMLVICLHTPTFDFYFC